MARALIVVDYQNDFTPGGALGVAGGDEIAARINELAGSGEFDLVVATRDWHPPDHGSFEQHGEPWPEPWGADDHPAMLVVDHRRLTPLGARSERRRHRNGGRPGLEVLPVVHRPGPRVRLDLLTQPRLGHERGGQLGAVQSAPAADRDDEIRVGYDLRHPHDGAKVVGRPHRNPCGGVGAGRGELPQRTEDLGVAQAFVEQDRGPLRRPRTELRPQARGIQDR